MDKKYIFFLFGAVAIFILVIACSSSDPAGPVDENEIDISGITETDTEGNVLGGDLTDWCYTSSKNADGIIPDEYAFYPAYPNPNCGTVTLAYDLPQQDSIHIYIIDTSGSVVTELVNETQDAGSYELTWEHESLGGHITDGGMYRAVMDCDGFECTGDIQSARPKMTLYAVHQDAENLTIKYTAEQPIAGLFMVLPTSGAVYSTNFSVNGMSAEYNIVDDSLRIIISVSPSGLNYLPATEEIKSFCWIYHESEISLDSAQVSDTLGIFMFDINISEELPAK